MSRFRYLAVKGAFIASLLFCVCPVSSASLLTFPLSPLPSPLSPSLRLSACVKGSFWCLSFTAFILSFLDVSFVLPFLIPLLVPSCFSASLLTSSSLPPPVLPLSTRRLSVLLLCCPLFSFPFPLRLYASPLPPFPPFPPFPFATFSAPLLAVAVVCGGCACGLPWLCAPCRETHAIDVELCGLRRWGGLCGQRWCSVVYHGRRACAATV